MRVHSLGHTDAPASALVLLNNNGEELLRHALPALAAPRELKPQTVDAVLRVPRNVSLQGARLRILLPDGIKEITQLNNEWVFP